MRPAFIPIVKNLQTALAGVAILSLIACSDNADQVTTGGLNTADAKAVDAAAAKLDAENQLVPAQSAPPAAAQSK